MCSFVKTDNELLGKGNVLKELALKTGTTLNQLTAGIVRAPFYARIC